MSRERATFVISDLHMGDGGPRDNFSVGNRESEFAQFLNYVTAEGGELLILGDLFEFWQVGLGRAIVNRRKLLDRLADMGAVYVLGNHDVDLRAFVGTASDFISHPFFKNMCDKFDRAINGSTFRFMHGHEVDPFNKGDSPGWGRILTIFAGIFEDKNGSPILAGGETVEGALESFGENMLRLWNWLVNKLKKSVSGGDSPSPKNELTPAQNPDRAEEMLLAYWQDRKANGYDVAVVGHTHVPGRIGDWYFNSGSWVGATNDFLRIASDGKVRLYKWEGGKAISCDKELPFQPPKE